MKTFRVSADHVVPKHACKDAVAHVHPDQDRWYAVMWSYGCGKSYATPEAAIREMLADHACTNIRMTLVEG